MNFVETQCQVLWKLWRTFSKIWTTGIAERTKVKYLFQTSIGMHGLSLANEDTAGNLTLVLDGLGGGVKERTCDTEATPQLLALHQN